MIYSSDLLTSVKGGGDAVNFIEEFYYGNIEPQQCNSAKNGEMRKKLNELARKEDSLTEKFDGELKEAFLDYTNTYNAFTNTCCADSFMIGFRLGARFTYDTFIDEKKG